MIASNYMKHTEALRFQREMFFNGYKNQPRFMRLMQCVFNQVQGTPGWFKAAKQKANALAKQVKEACMNLAFEPEATRRKATNGYTRMLERVRGAAKISVAAPYRLACAGLYRRYCHTSNHNLVVGGWTPNYAGQE